jgi:hypothetical protein
MTTASKRTFAVAIAVIAVAAMIGVGIAVLNRGANATASSNTPAQAGGRFGQAPPNSAALQKFRQCLQQNGVTPRQPGTSGSGPRNDPAFAQAMQACRQYMPQRAPGSGFGPPGSGQNPTPSQQPTTAPGTSST